MTGATSGTEIGGVMDNVLALTVGDLVKPKTIKWLFLALTSENQDWMTIIMTKQIQ
jgi:hypothetical protein